MSLDEETAHGYKICIDFSILLPSVQSLMLLLLSQIFASASISTFAKTKDRVNTSAFETKPGFITKFGQLSFLNCPLLVAFHIIMVTSIFPARKQTESNKVGFTCCAPCRFHRNGLFMKTPEKPSFCVLRRHLLTFRRDFG